MQEYQEEFYRGPNVNPSAWSLWELAEGMHSQTRIRYLAFRHRRIGSVVEIAEGSTGDFRYRSNDCETPWMVTRRGNRKSVPSFGAPELVYRLYSRSIPGRRMSQPMERFGDWVVEVMSSNIAITNPFAVCALPNILVSGKGKTDNVQLRIVLTLDSFMVIGDAVSINVAPIAFQVSHGVSEAVDISWEEACKHVKLANYQGIFAFSVEEIQANKGRTQAELEAILEARKPRNDVLGEIRRTMSKSTKFKREQNACAEEFLSLPVVTRIKAIDSVELENLANVRGQGHISLAEFLRRSDAIKKLSDFPSRPLRAKESLDQSMYLDPDSKDRIPNSVFSGWSELSWSERMAAVRTMERREARREGDPQSPASRTPTRGGYLADDVDAGSDTTHKESDIRHLDPDLPPDRARSRHYQAMMRGELSGGMRKWGTVERYKERADKVKVRLGQEIAQIYEECEVCGRPCLIPGSGKCPRCREFERQNALIGLDSDTRRPDTYLGDPRALLGHPGFDHYIPAPPPEEQFFRHKIDPTHASTTAETRRSMLAGLAGVEPEEDSPVPVQTPGKARRRSSRGQFQMVVEQPSAVESAAAPPPQPPVELDKLHALIKSNRFDDVKSLLLRYQNEPIPSPSLGLTAPGEDGDGGGPGAGGGTPPAGGGPGRVVDVRDEHGNTPLIAAVQQGRRRMTKLLLAAEAALDAQNKEGNTALHYAAMYHYTEIFDYLRARGADDSITNVAGLVPYQMVGRAAAKERRGDGDKPAAAAAGRAQP